jgi:hypothetical protein
MMVMKSTRRLHLEFNNQYFRNNLKSTRRLHFLKNPTSPKSSINQTNLDLCCGKHNWFGRPEAREPGVLTDCDRQWWGEPYLKVNENSKLINKWKHNLTGQICYERPFSGKTDFFVVYRQKSSEKLSSICYVGRVNLMRIGWSFLLEIKFPLETTFQCPTVNY